MSSGWPEHVLVVGGAGYIGSHMVAHLGALGIRVTVLDDLSSGHADAVDGSRLIRGDYGDPHLLDEVLSSFDITAVMHFASGIEVAESCRHPDRYYRNNTVASLNLLEAMHRHGVNRIVFSSSAAIYGDVPGKAITEKTPCVPVSPYGRSKLMVEWMLEDFGRAFGLRAVSLRYFNAAGAHPEGHLGERHDPESHLIPLVMQVASGRREAIRLFGTDYPTPDGTCIRDFVHVQDLCRAHYLALQQLAEQEGVRAYNLGSGGGTSIRELIRLAERVTERSVTVLPEGRREGDPTVLVADATLARRELGWQPEYSLEDMLAHAWVWESKLMSGQELGNSLLKA